MEWTCRPAAIKAAIVVKQPQLELSLAGPADMTFGEEKTFTLVVAQPRHRRRRERGRQPVVGRRLAGSRSRSARCRPGQRKEMPLQIVASQAGEMEIHAVASGDGGLAAEAAGKIIVRKAELAVVVEGPPLKYAGTEAAYLVTVHQHRQCPGRQRQLAAGPARRRRSISGGIDGATRRGRQPQVEARQPARRQREGVRGAAAAQCGRGRTGWSCRPGAGGGTASGEAETEVEAAPT